MFDDGANSSVSGALLPGASYLLAVTFLLEYDISLAGYADPVAAEDPFMG